MKLLLIMPNFFEYPIHICNELEKMGYEVDFFDDRPSTNACIKAILRVNKKLIQGYIKKYFCHIMKFVEAKCYDIVFLISGQSLSLSEDMIKRIRECQKQAYFFLYQWDSHKNFPYIKSIQKYFDKIYSFDKGDVGTTPGLKFLPLFYTKEYEKIGEENNKNFLYDFSFVGTAHPKKYKFIKMMSEQLREIYPKQFIYFFFPSRIVFFYRKICNKELKKAHYNEFHYVPLKSNEMQEVYRSSRCILDAAQEGQIGLTIRVLEALGARKKIITTNEDIINYDFYNPENIYIYKGKIDMTDPFFKEEYHELDSAIYEKYTLRNWLREILE